MKHFFILGTNKELCRAEIFSWLEKNKIKFNWETAGEDLIIDCEKLKINVQEFGGVKAIGKVLCSDDVTEYITKNEIYFGTETGFTYSIYGDDSILENVKEKFRKEKLKSRYSTKLDADYGFFYVNGNFGFIEQVYNSSDDERRDMKKPVRRSELAISPRLARILVNLSQVKRGEKFCDCFCGIGVLLQESLLIGIESIGIDIDKKAIQGAEKNMRWLEKTYKINAKYKLINADSSKIKLEKINGIACEPSLGKLLTSVPSLEEADKMISKFQWLMISVLKNIKHALTNGNKIVFTSPLIRTQKGDLGIDINSITDRTRLKMAELEDVKFPLTETREKKIVSREIWVLEA